MQSKKDIEIMEMKQEPYLLETESGIFELKMIHGSGVYIKNESNSPTSDIVFQSEGELQRQNNEVDIKIKIKEEPGSLETMLPEVKFESEVTHGLDVHIKNESAFLTSDVQYQSDCEIHKDDGEIEIKEEAVDLEITSPKVKSTLKEINVKEMDFNTEDTALEEDQGLTDSSRISHIMMIKIKELHFSGGDLDPSLPDYSTMDKVGKKNSALISNRGLSLAEMRQQQFSLDMQEF